MTLPGKSDYELVRVKRAWVPDWLWRLFCVGNLATFTPWRQILTRKPVEPRLGKWVSLGLLVAGVVIIWRVRLLRALVLGLVAGAALGTLH